MALITKPQRRGPGNVTRIYLYDGLMQSGRIVENWDSAEPVEKEQSGASGIQGYIR